MLTKQFRAAMSLKCVTSLSLLLGQALNLRVQSNLHVRDDGAAPEIKTRYAAKEQMIEHSFLWQSQGTVYK